jgi:hypothetical protein
MPPTTPIAPLFIYALTLAGLLTCGIAYLMGSIVMKHRRRLQSFRIQRRFIAHLNQASQASLAPELLQVEILHINQLIQLYKKDIANAWMRLLEGTPSAERSPYIQVATQTNLLHCIPHCLYEEGLPERCIALEAIGLSGFSEFAHAAETFSCDPGVAPYACIALARLNHSDALPYILKAYQQGVLTTTQALSAITEISPAQIQNYLDSHPNTQVSDRLLAYLKS